MATRRKFLSLLKGCSTALAVFVAVVEGRVAASALGRDHRLDAMEGDLLSDGVGVVATIGEQRPERATSSLDALGSRIKRIEQHRDGAPVDQRQKRIKR